MKRASLLPLTLLVLTFRLSSFTSTAQEVLLPLQRTSAQPQPPKTEGVAVGLPFFDDFATGCTPTPTLWEAGGVTVGTGYGELPPTIGMATLDALGPDGFLYPQASTSPFPADTLCSLPIRLDRFRNTDRIVFSFFYLPGGGSGNMWERIGDTPDDADSLFLDFYSPSDSTWQNVWGRGGISVDTLMAQTGKAWQYVSVSIDNPAYLDSAFRFRFRNRCSLDDIAKTGMKGNCDQWNIDYVLIDTGRVLNAPPIWRDIAFVTPAPSALGVYQAMPARQFRTTDQLSNLPMTITNLYSSELASHYSYCILGPDGDTVHRYDGGFENAPADGFQTIAAHANPPLGNFTFPEGTEQATYTFIHTVSEGVGGDDHRQNDTVRFSQVFSDYYAYDDGTAENGYGLTSTAARVYMACRFDLAAEDTLTTVAICFNSTFNNENEAISFYLTVWQADSEGQPGTVLYSDSQRRHPVVDGVNRFYNYVLESPVVASGSIFVGFEQVGNNFINLGFDRNTQSADRIWYLTSTEWQQSILRGSLMLRPHFGVAASVGIVERVVDGEKLKVWPNPAHDVINIDGMSEGTAVEVYDMTGRLRLSGRSSILSTHSLPAGPYLLRIGGNAVTTLIIKR